MRLFIEAPAQRGLSLVAISTRGSREPLVAEDSADPRPCPAARRCEPLVATRDPHDRRASRIVVCDDRIRPARERSQARPIATRAPRPTDAHAVVSAAAADVLAGFFHDDRDSFAVTSEVLPGVARSFTSFSAAADEASVSRIYAGQHFRFDQGQASASDTASPTSSGRAP
jgi:hypothetical protein